MMTDYSFGAYLVQVLLDSESDDMMIAHSTIVDLRSCSVLRVSSLYWNRLVWSCNVLFGLGLFDDEKTKAKATAKGNGKVIMWFGRYSWVWIWLWV